MRQQFARFGSVILPLLMATALAGCQTTKVYENRLSTGQRVAIVESTGGGFAPSTSTVLLTGGSYRAVNGGTGQPFANVAVGAIGGAAAAAAGRPSINMSQSQGQGQASYNINTNNNSVNARQCQITFAC